MCAKGLGGVREVGFRGKLSHHLFIQSTEDRVSRGGGRGEGCCLLRAALGILEVKSCFLATSTILCLEKKVEPKNKQHSTALDLLST